MARSPLKRLLGPRRPAGRALSALLRDAGWSVAICEPDGRVVLGDPEGIDGERHPIEVEGETLGHVVGREHAGAIAGLVSHLATVEASKKALGGETLSLYREVNLLYKLSEKLASVEGLASVGDLILDEARRVIDVTGGAVWLAEEEELRVVASFGHPELSEPIPTGRGLVGDMVRRGRPELVADVCADARHGGADAPYGAMICAPLKAQDRVIGAVALVGERDAFSASDLKLLIAVASQGAPAVESVLSQARALREAEERERMHLQEQEIGYLKEINRLKDEFVRMASHDLKNPIGVIRGYAEILREEGFATDPEADQLLGRIESAASRMLALVTDILDLAKVEDGLSYSPTDVELGGFLEGIYEEFRMQAERKQIDLVYVPVGLLRLRMDVERMRQVLSNLVSNAVKYTPERGRVELRTVVDEDTVQLSVVDTGLGIPEESLPHLFEKFYRVDRSEHMASEGTGLGLAIVKAIVEQHQGEIHVESKIGEGTAFHVRLPLAG